MKKIIVILVLSLCLTGCFDYRDVNRVIFVTALCIDIDENNNPVLYAETFASTRGTGEIAGEETRILFKGSGETVFEAIRVMNTTSALKLNYTQNKAIIFSERAAQYGLDNFIDPLIRDQELLVRQFFYVSAVDIEELLKIKLDEDIFMGVFLADLSENRPARTKMPQIRIDEFFISRKLGSKINTISFIEKFEDPVVDRVVINKLAVINEDKMIDTLDYDETFFYNIITDNLKLGYIKIPNPDAEGKLITLETLKIKTNTHINYDDGNTIDIKKEINIKTTIADTQVNFNISNMDKKRKLEETAEEHIKKGATDLYEKFKEKDIDLFNLKRSIDIKYPNANLDEDNILKSINLIIEPKIFIEGSTDVIDFY